MQFLNNLAARAQAFAESLGGPGLTIVAFVDSSFLTLPEVADILVVLFSIRSPESWLYFTLMTTIGSISGSYALFLVGRKGGEAMLRRKFHERHVDRGLAWFKRFGAGLLVVPAMMPPPMPFKLLVLLSGVSGVARLPFVAAVAIGRGIRYGAEAYLATLYGDQVLTQIRENGIKWALPLAAVAVIVGALWWAWRRRETRRRPTSGGRPEAPGNVE